MTAPLLELRNVEKHWCHGSRVPTALRKVNLAIERGEFVGVWGERRSGRTTLLRIAAGLEQPDGGLVLCEGDDLARGRGLFGDGRIARRIAYCDMRWNDEQAETIVDHVAIALLARGVSLKDARARAHAALLRTGLRAVSALAANELSPTEGVQAAIARALVVEPLLMLVDEPTNHALVEDRDAILRLLRAIANEGTAILMTASDMAALAGVDRALALADGELRGRPAAQHAVVTPLRPRTAEPPR